MEYNIGYNDSLDADEQISTEERIAALVFEQAREGACEATCAQIGRDVLLLVLRQFRPDLIG